MLGEFAFSDNMKKMIHSIKRYDFYFSTNYWEECKQKICESTDVVEVTDDAFYMETEDLNDYDFINDNIQHSLDVLQDYSERVTRVPNCEGVK